MKRASVGVQSVVIGGIIAFISSIIGGVIVALLTKNNEIETRRYENFYNASQLFLDSYYNKFNSDNIKSAYILNYENNLYLGLCNYLRNDHLYHACSIDPFNFLVNDYEGLTTGNLYILKHCSLDEPLDCFLNNDRDNIPPQEVLSVTRIIQYENLFLTVKHQLNEFISLNYKNKMLIDDNVYIKSIENINKQIISMESKLNFINEIYIAPTDIREKKYNIDDFDIRKHYYKNGYFNFLNNEVVELFKNELKEYLKN